MYMTYKTYTISEFRDNTRSILNEALNEPVYIKRHTDQFMISNATEQPIKMAYGPAEKQIFGQPIDKIVAVKPRRNPKPELKIETWTHPAEADAGIIRCKTHGLPVAEGRKTCLMKGCK